MIRVAQKSRSWGRRRLGPLLVAGGLSIVALLQAPGLLIADTKLDLALDPGGFLDRLRDLWDPTASFGQLPNQAVGYWFPMGPFFWFGERIGLSPWIVQRIWISALLVIAFWGMLRLLEALGVGRPSSRLVGALWYALTPTLLVQVAYRSGQALPMVFLPLALLPLVTGSTRGSPRQAAARSSVAVALMGGVNGAATFFVLAVPVIYLLTRERGARRRRLASWWFVLIPAVTIWWVAPLFLQLGYGSDFLAVTEQAATTTSSNSLTEVLRGTGYWEMVLDTGGIPWLPAGIRFVSHAPTVLATMLLASVAVVSLTLDGLRERRFLLLVLMAGIVALAAGYAGPISGPFAGAIQDLLDGPLAPARNVHKFVPLVALPLAVGVAHGLDLWARRCATWERPRWFVRHRFATGIVVAAVLLAAATPALLGELAPPGAFEKVPTYWQEAIDHINEEGSGGRTLLVPGSPWAEYDWGRPLDEPLQPLADDPWAVRNIVPLGGLEITRFMDGVESLLEQGRQAEGLADALRRAGVEWVLVRNDLDLLRTSSPPPTQVRRALEGASGLTRVGSWGPLVDGGLERRHLAPDLTPPDDLRALELYRVDGEVSRATAAPVADLTVVSGMAESMLGLAESGVVTDGPVVLRQDVVDALPNADRQVITDDLRRRDVDFGRVHESDSYTLTPSEIAPDFPASAAREPTDRLPRVGEEDLAVAEFDGIAAVRASSYFTGYGRVPGHQPYSAIDGDPETAWTPGAFRSIEGEWWEVQFDRPRSVPWLRIRLPATSELGGWIRAVTVRTDTDRHVVRFTEPQSSADITLPDTPTGRIRLTIEDARGGFFDIVTPGLAEVTIPGISPGRTVVLPPVTDSTPDETVITFSRERGDPFSAATGDEELLIDRTLTLSTDQVSDVRGTATAVPGEALDDLLLSLDGDRQPAAVASSTWQDLPAFRADHVADTDPRTSWLADPADPDPTLTVNLAGSQAVTGLEVDPVPTPGRAITEIEVSGGGATRSVDVDGQGVATFPPIQTDQLTLHFPNDLTDSQVERSLLGLRGLTVRSDGSGVRPVDTDPSFRLPCGEGPVVDIAGEQTSTRVRGRTSDLIMSRPVPFEGCRPVALDAGTSRIRVMGRSGLRADSLVFGSSEPADGEASRSVEIADWGREHRVLAVGPGDEALLMTDENANPGWTAVLDGEPMEPLVADGWRQAWILPAGSGGEVDLRFDPGGPYDRALQAGLVFGLLAVLALVVPGRADLVGAGARPVSSLLVLGAGTLTLFLTSGVWALAVPILWIRGRVRPLVHVVVAGLLLATVLLVLRNLSWTADALYRAWPFRLSQVLCTIALAAVFARGALDDEGDR